jgi:hypothetical protein
MGGTSSLQLERDLFPLLIEPVEGFFIILSGNALSLQLLSPPGGDKKKNVVGHSAEVYSQGKDSGDQSKVGLCDRGIDLKLNASFSQPFDASQGSLKGARHFSEAVMALCVRTIQADADPLDP